MVPMYNLITVLRLCLIIICRTFGFIVFSRVFNMTEKSKRITDFLEDHLEVWREDPEFMAKYKVVVDYVRNTLKLNLNEDKILRVITSSYTNDFSHSLANGNQAQLMFPLTAMMNHSCQPSISRWRTSLSRTIHFKDISGAS